MDCFSESIVASFDKKSCRSKHSMCFKNASSSDWTEDYGFSWSYSNAKVTRSMAYDRVSYHPIVIIANKLRGRFEQGPMPRRPNEINGLQCT